jgi:hypothetical protein
MELGPGELVIGDALIEAVSDGRQLGDVAFDSRHCVQPAGRSRQVRLPPDRDSWFTSVMSDAESSGEIEITVETEEIDVDGDGVIDAVVETTTTSIDVDGDGVVDVIQQTTVTAVDVDGDGVADIIDETTVTGVDVDGDGEFSDDEIEVEETIAVRDDLLDEG